MRENTLRKHAWSTYHNIFTPTSSLLTYVLVITCHSFHFVPIDNIKKIVVTKNVLPIPLPKLPFDSNNSKNIILGKTVK